MNIEKQLKNESFLPDGKTEGLKRLFAIKSEVIERYERMCVLDREISAALEEMNGYRFYSKQNKSCLIGWLFV